MDLTRERKDYESFAIERLGRYADKVTIKNALILYGLIASKALGNGTDEIQLSNVYISELTGLSVQSVIFCANYLQAVNLITRDKTEAVKGKGSKYKLLEVPKAEGEDNPYKEELIRSIARNGIRHLSNISLFIGREVSDACENRILHILNVLYFYPRPTNLLFSLAFWYGLVCDHEETIGINLEKWRKGDLKRYTLKELFYVGDNLFTKGMGERAKEAVRSILFILFSMGLIREEKICDKFEDEDGNTFYRLVPTTASEILRHYGFNTDKTAPQSEEEKPTETKSE